MSPFRIVLGVGIAVILVGSMLIGTRGDNKPENGSSPPSENNIDGNILEDTNNSYSIMLPANFVVEDNGMYSKLIRKEAKQPGAGPTNFIYISTVIKGKEGEEGSIYNYSTGDFQTLVRMRQGDRTALGGGEASPTKEYFTYEAIEGRMLGGYGAKGFKNSKPWEFPSGTIEYRYIVETEPVHYIVGAYIGAYIGGDQNEYMLSQAEVDQILSTLKLTPDSVSIKTSASDVSAWKPYTNPENGLSFQYPANWKEDTGGQNFSDGDLYGITMVGQTQRIQTEFYDGARFVVMKPVSTDENVMSWVKNKYDAQPNPETDQKPQYSKETFGQITYDKVYVCGLGCFSYYHTKQNGKIYGFLFFAAGAEEQTYSQIFQQVMESVKFI